MPFVRLSSAQVVVLDTETETEAVLPRSFNPFVRRRD